MGPYLEVWTGGRPRLMALGSGRLTIGKQAGNDLVIDDATASRLHAALEPYGPGWCVKDLGSRNGTLVNGRRASGDVALRPGDEILIGGTRIVFRSDDERAGPVTEATEGVPDLTRREREVLVALCRPVLDGTMLSGPASVADIARDLVVTVSAVKKHVANLYEKFGIDPASRSRGRLAGDAIRRGAVSPSDL